MNAMELERKCGEEIGAAEFNKGVRVVRRAPCAVECEKKRIDERLVSACFGAERLGSFSCKGRMRARNGDAEQESNVAGFAIHHAPRRHVQTHCEVARVIHPFTMKPGRTQHITLLTLTKDDKLKRVAACILDDSS